MSRSVYTFSSFSTAAAVSCVVLLVAGCRFATNPGDMVDVDAGALTPSILETDTDASVSDHAADASAVERSADGSPPIAAESAPTVDPAKASTAASTAAAGEHAPSSTATPPQAGNASPPGAASPPQAGNASPPGAASPPQAGNASPPGAASPPQAGNLNRDAGTTANASDLQCATDLADCLLRDPLGYAACLRMNQDNGCPEPDAGMPTTSPVTTEDGKPLSQACQAELADCIARLPTPENAASCAEKARTCK